MKQKNETVETILVTGGAGYIGGQTVLCLLDAGYNVVVLDDLSTGRICSFHEQTVFYEGKVHDQELVEQIIEQHNIRSIMHFAGSIKVDESVSNPLKYYHNNTEGSRLLIEAAISKGIQRFIFSSTAAVYGEVPKGEKVTEKANTYPLNPYGWSKLFTERQLVDVNRAHGLQYGILRYFNVAGADMSGRHGQYLEKPVHLIGRAIDAMRGVVPPLTVFGKALPTRDGTGVRDYIHVQDLASAHVDLLGYLKAETKSALYNLGYGKGLSVLEVINTLEQISGEQVPHVFGIPREGEAPEVVADNTKLVAELGWQPKYDTIDEIIASSLKWLALLEGNNR
ncbi:UDP-glucose 4-epimerase GalE [Kordiimonas sp. SCSIO 12603]|uniref:UDP-glucose 4-epimerase GalE n=1 Tax=Kordiimonas sp. SCSIO 12603 TaxID=2829596 RepID=UPI00210285E7|nr:UDP-glucose 4-epimerase GalE [Kordiimonas sp. SCSIO 12603]UTW57588.1 UDP-glucose 4-epimerase GalE [Kordiimonas sp. SCSIO 12603]